MTTPADWTFADIPDLAGMHVVVTGGNSGLGYESARLLSSRGASTLIASRNRQRADAAATAIRDRHPGAIVATAELDLARLSSVETFAGTIAAEHDRIDILINNAGVMLLPHGHTTDGFEQHFGINHLGHFALTGRLLPLLSNAASGRVVTVSSLAHRDGEIDFDELGPGGGADYDAMAAYRRSKLANLLFGFELDRRLRRADSDISSVVAHPGLAGTDLAGHLAERWWWRVVRPAIGLVIQSAESGARSIVRAATDRSVASGQYIGPGGSNEFRGAPIAVEAAAKAHDPVLAGRLWDLSEELTGVRYP